MFFDKIKKRQSGILLYGITPPKQETSPERIAAIAEKTIFRLRDLDIDALIVYDVQDESARTLEQRPFPFINALDPFEFANSFLHDLKIKKIIYRPAGKFSTEELARWMESMHQQKFYPVFVGLPTPDYPIKSTLQEAYNIWNPYQASSVLGAITIPERHAKLLDEDKRIVEKVKGGVSYFISQCVFNIDYAKRMIKDIADTFKQINQELPTIIFTLSVCGSPKTLQFMEWLGVHIPGSLKTDLKSADNMLEKSVAHSINIANELIAYCVQLSVPFGFNIESVAIKKDEIEASIFMFNKIKNALEKEGIRTNKTFLSKEHKLAK